MFNASPAVWDESSEKKLSRAEIQQLEKVVKKNI